MKIWRRVHNPQHETAGAGVSSSGFCNRSLQDVMNIPNGGRLPEHGEQVHRQEADGEHDDDADEHLGGLPTRPELSLSAGVHVHRERVHHGAAATVVAADVCKTNTHDFQRSLTRPQVRMNSTHKNVTGNDNSQFSVQTLSQGNPRMWKSSLN